jgi:hypothetical protein
MERSGGTRLREGRLGTPLPPSYGPQSRAYLNRAWGTRPRGQLPFDFSALLLRLLDTPKRPASGTTPTQLHNRGWTWPSWLSPFAEVEPLRGVARLLLNRGITPSNLSLPLRLRLVSTLRRASPTQIDALAASSYALFQKFRVNVYRRIENPRGRRCSLKGYPRRAASVGERSLHPLADRG